MGDVLQMVTMLFDDEIVDPARIDDVPDPAEVKATKREVDIAKQLVDSLTGDFEPSQYRDTYREQVLDLIDRKAQGEQISVQPPKDEAAEPVPDLMAALKASLDAVRERDGDGAAPKKKPARKREAKPAAKPARSGAKSKR